MKRFFISLLIIISILTFFSSALFALNPFITHLYNADPSAHVFENRMYVYPSHDKDIRQSGAFYDMEDYHVYSSADLQNWVDHGMFLKIPDVKWAKYHFWAPDCNYKNGKYYFYFPACINPLNGDNPNTGKNNWHIGVAIANSPIGPFIPLDNYIHGTDSVDPCIFIDDDGQAYLFWGGQGHGGYTNGTQGPKYGKLRSNMIEFEYDSSGNEIIKNITGSKTAGAQYYFEAPWVFYRYDKNGKKWYYLSYSIGNNRGDTYLSEIDYAVTDNINNDSWVWKGGVIENDYDKREDPYYIDEQTGRNTIGWTIHHSFTQFKGDWYAFYQSSNISNGDTFKRAICVDKLVWNDDVVNNTPPLMITVYKTIEGPFGTSAYSRIKAMFFSDTDRRDTYNSKPGNVTFKVPYIVQEDANGPNSSQIDIGKRICYMSNNNWLLYKNINFGSIRAIGFEAEVASGVSGNNVGYIEVIDNDSGKTLGNISVNGTGGWSNWVIRTCYFKEDDQIVGNAKNIKLVFHNNNNNTYSMNLNWFKFIYDNNDPNLKVSDKNIPIIQSVPLFNSIALKAKNYSVDNNDYLEGDTYSGNYSSLEKQNYLCADKYKDYNLYANRAGWGKENKFSILNGVGYNTIGVILLELNSSSNGRNLTIPSDYYNNPVNALGGDFRAGIVYPEDVIQWSFDDDDYIYLKNNYNNQYMATCYSPTDATSKNPLPVYTNDNWSSYYGDKRFVCEVQDAPIGCTVTFKTLSDIDFIAADDGNGNSKGYGYKDRMYLSVDTWKNSGQLCAHRVAVCKSNSYGVWEKFLVVDAKNGYVALKSYNNKDQKPDYQYQYLRVNTSNNNIVEATGGNTIDSNYERFQWINNGDGTISLRNIATGQVLCVDASKGTSPAKVYANKSSVSTGPNSWEKFYCQIAKAPDGIVLKP